MVKRFVEKLVALLIFFEGCGDKLCRMGITGCFQGFNEVCEFLGVVLVVVVHIAEKYEVPVFTARYIVCVRMLMVMMFMAAHGIYPLTKNDGFFTVQQYYTSIKYYYKGVKTSRL